jgi:dipeptidyl aminopeptidase/acylaminoacyl peptidase
MAVMSTALSSFARRVQRAAVLIATLGACAISVPARGQSLPPTSLLAYTQSYCECTSAACNAFCASITGSYIVSALGRSWGTFDHSPSWSPDASRIAFVSGTDIVVMDASTGPPLNLTNTPSLEYAPAWSPDGNRIAFLSDRDGQAAMYLMNTNGSGVVRVTTAVRSDSRSRLTWSPDSTLIGFDCEVDAGNEDICVIGAAGSGFRRLTLGPGRDINPAWSPDGQRIAFATDRYAPGATVQLALMRSDGSAVSLIGGGIAGWSPAWASDGRHIAFEAANYYQYEGDLYVMSADGSGVSFVAEAATSPSWAAAAALLLANFTVGCTGFVCSVDASSSTGTISDYAWSFGDGATASGSIASHMYADGGVKTIQLTVIGADGSTRILSRIITLNRPPVAAITVTCVVLTCTFDWSGSYDPDGTGLTISFDWGSAGVYNWSNVDNSGTKGRLTYPAPGTYTVTIQVSDDSGGRAIASQTFTLGTPSMHIGDLDVTSTAQPNTSAVAVQVHDASHQPVAQAVVTLSSNGTATCKTDANGRCVVSTLKLSARRIVTVTNVVRASFIYKSQSNHDPDGDSNGTVITVPRR